MPQVYHVVKGLSTNYLFCFTDIHIFNVSRESSTGHGWLWDRWGMQLHTKHFPRHLGDPFPVDSHMYADRSDEADACPGVDHIPGCVSEDEHRISCPSPAGDEQEVHPADGGQYEADGYHSIEDQVPAPAWVKAAAFTRQFIPGAPRHAGYPLPVDSQVDNGGSDHRHAAPGMNIIPGLAGEEDLNVIQWIAPALKAACGQEEEVNSREGGDRCADKKGCIDPPVLLSLFGNYLCRHGISLLS